MIYGKKCENLSIKLRIITYYCHRSEGVETPGGGGMLASGASVAEHEILEQNLEFSCCHVVVVVKTLPAYLNLRISRKSNLWGSALECKFSWEVHYGSKTNHVRIYMLSSFVLWQWANGCLSCFKADLIIKWNKGFVFLILYWLIFTELWTVDRTMSFWVKKEL